MIDFGVVRPGTTLYIPFATYDSNDPTASVTMTGLATTDIEIYKDGSVTQRASDAGYALLDTDGIDFDSVTGLHGFSVDLANNTTAGFYAAGSQYWIVVSSVTVDAGVVSFIAATFRIGYPDAVLNTTIATLSTQTSFTLTSGPAEDDALNGRMCVIHDVASAVQVGHAVISDYVGSTKTVTLAAGTTFTAAATDNISILGLAPLQPTTTGNKLDVTSTGAAGIDWGNVENPTTALDLSGTDIQLVDTATTVTNQVTADMTAISGDTTAADNLELQYDGTGLTGDNYPATQSQLSGLSIASAAASVKCKASPDGFVLITGSEVNTEDSTFALDGTRHELTDSAGTLDGYYKFDIGAFGLPVSVTFEAVINGGNDTFTFYANTGSSGTPVWSERQTVTGTGSASNVSVSVPLFESDVVSDITNETWIRVAGTGLSSASFDTDFLLLSRAIQSQYSGYDNGQVWGDTSDGTAGTTSGYNGISSRPTNSLANAITIGSNVGIDRYHWSGDSTVTFTESHTDEVWASDGGTLALGGQDCSSSTFVGWNSVSGIATMASGEAHFVECEIDNATVGSSHFKKTGFGGTLTLGAATDYFLVDCYSQIAGATSPIIDMGAAVGATNLSIRRWSGGLTINNLAAGDVVTLDGIFGTITLNGADAQVEIRGIAKAVTNNLTGSPAVNDDTLKTDIQEDWTDGGRLDLILDELTTQGDTNETKLDTIDTVVDSILADTVSLGITKNATFSNFEFLMVDATDFATPETGLTVTGQRSIDGAAFAAVSGAIAEVGSGIYQFDALAADTNGDVITWKFSSAGAADRFVTFKTRA